MTNAIDRVLLLPKVFISDKIPLPLEKSPISPSTVKQSFMNLFLVVLSKICKSRKKLFPYKANFSNYCQSKFYDSGKEKFGNNLIGKSFVDNAVWIVDAGYALMSVIPKDRYRISFNNSFR